MILPSIAQVIAHVESAGRGDAMRFEPAVYERALAGSYGPQVAAAVTAHKCSQATARVIVSTSWGKFQLMGFNLYPNLTGLSVAAFMSTPQDPAFGKFLAIKRLDHFTAQQLFSDLAARLSFATVYNGPGNPQAYADLILSAFHALGAE